MKVHQHRFQTGSPGEKNGTGMDWQRHRFVGILFANELEKVAETSKSPASESTNVIIYLAIVCILYTISYIYMKKNSFNNEKKCKLCQFLCIPIHC